MTRNIGKGEVSWTDELNRGCLEHSVVLFADEPGILDGFGGDVVQPALGADDAYVVGMGLESVKRDIYQKAVSLFGRDAWWTSSR